MKCIFLLLLCALSIHINAQTTYYVDKSAVGLNDGSSWLDAFDDIQKALDLAIDGDSVLVAEGTYLPSQPMPACTSGTNRDYTFYISKNIIMLGGYPSGGGTRKWPLNKTYLSGNIGNKTDSTDNAYHVVVIEDTDSTFLLSGFHIRDGVADGSSSCASIPREYGGGIYLKNAMGTIQRNQISTNTAERGGGIYKFSSSFIIDSIVVMNNYALDNGGGIFDGSGNLNISNSSIANNTCRHNGAMRTFSDSVIITNCIISGNEGTSGDCIFINSKSTRFTNCEISDNTGFTSVMVIRSEYYTEIINSKINNNYSNRGTGAIQIIDGYHASVTGSYFIENTNTITGTGALSISQDSCTLELKNCVFINNTGYNANAIYCRNLNSNITNTSFINNQTTNSYDRTVRISTENSMNITNCIFTETNPIDTGQNVNLGVNYSNIKGNWNGVGNIDTTIHFVDSANGDFRLKITSPCINAGINDSLDVSDTLDILGNPRIYQNVVDMGAFEYFVPCNSITSRIYVDASANGQNNGECWENAYKELYDGIGAADNGDTIFIAQADYLPKPSISDPRLATFTISKKITLLGGYPAGGSLDLDRNTNLFRPVISGDIGIPNDNRDNSYRVVNFDGPGALTARMIGLSIEHGNANAMGHLSGAALHLDDKIYMEDVIIQNNRSNKNGPITFTSASGYLILDKCTLRQNPISDMFLTLLGAQVEINEGTMIE